MWIDFDAFLEAPAEQLQVLAAFFDLNSEETERLARHPLMGRYSKAADYEYGPEQRAAALAEARREHAKAIADGMRWLERATSHVPTLDLFL